MRAERVITFVVAVCAVAASVRATEPFFTMAPGETTCFLSDVPADTQLVASFALLAVNTGTPSAQAKPALLRCWVTDPDGFTVAQTEQGGAKSGALTVRSVHAGEYRTCIAPTASRWAAAGDTYNVALSLRDGVESINYANIAKAEELNNLQLALRRANDQVVHIRNEQSYQRTRESRFRLTSESTSRRVFWLAVLQIFVFAGCTIFQLLSLRSFFKKNKLY